MPAYAPGMLGAWKLCSTGKPLGALGPRGQVRTVLFTQNNYEVLKTPVHISLVSFNQTAAPELFPRFPEPFPGS